MFKTEKGAICYDEAQKSLKSTKSFISCKARNGLEIAAWTISEALWSGVKEFETCVFNMKRPQISRAGSCKYTGAGRGAVS